MLAVDMPIGLPERTGKGGRGPENLVRLHLDERQSSVFSIRRAAPSMPSGHDPSGHDIEEVAPRCNWS
ncbi:DUF429 domain-containing protein [Mesorhizobium sp. J18]|uniref:DUF429 domain-containing protein n=1 Tax=Mesorhizobium sp. J18 TaxID=935263 RepID=UPI001FEF21D9|nr:DUF429 domain-containing protein [Mesorhizobium sp. J18]